MAVTIIEGLNFGLAKVKLNETPETPAAWLLRVLLMSVTPIFQAAETRSICPLLSKSPVPIATKVRLKAAKESAVFVYPG